MRSGRVFLVVALLVVGAAGCGDDGDGSSAGAGDGSAPPVGDDPVDLDPDAFSATIDNEWWPMAPGTRWTFRETEDGEELEVVVTVSSETKVIDGITARVVRDTVRQDGELIEDTFDWYAQADDGTVWYLGEETAEFEDGELASTEGSFEAGVDGALAGVVVLADPQPGIAYRQEYLEGEAEDAGEVLSVEEQVEVEAGHYEPALLTKDTNPLEPEVLEYKLYARGVGPVLAIHVSGGSGREELIEMTTVSDDVAAAAGTTPLGEDYG